MDDETRSSVTAWLTAWGRGDGAARERVIEAIYPELRRLAAHLMARERPSHTLQPTSVVHEVYLRLIDIDRVDWRDKAHFMAVAARVMRQVLVDHARERNAVKRGGDLARVTLSIEPSVGPKIAVEILDLDRALEELEKVDPDRCRLVELRWFGGLSLAEAAVVLDLSARTLKRRWRSTRAWLEHRLATA